jgi:carboxylesterase type B
MHSAWVAFASSGDPGWPAYDTDHRRTMRFDTASAVVEDPRVWERAFWEGLR